MDPEIAAFQPRDDLWRIQDDILRMHQSQQEISDRVSRLERRNEDDSRLKNVWGGASPFPSVLGGTPQQGATPVQSCIPARAHMVLPRSQCSCAWLEHQDCMIFEASR